MKQTKDTAQFHSWTEMAKTRLRTKQALPVKVNAMPKKKVQQASGTPWKARMALP